MSDVKVFAEILEASAAAQIQTLAEQPAFEGARIRIMPDAHSGTGCVIGFTADLGSKVVPNLVGVDIGCGMFAVPVPAIDDWAAFDACVREYVPAGFSVHGRDTCDVTELGLLCEPELKNIQKLNRSLGTLGGGNHFVEVDTSDTGCLLVIHSGSRNLGLQVAHVYQAKAEEQCRTDVPTGLKFLEGELAAAYLHDMRICQEWAKANREQMAAAIIGCMFGKPFEGFHTVHNYIGDDGIIRKGAISAKRGERVLIPLNMRDGAVIGIGKGNADWNESAPHGAGRLMSRAQARRDLSVSDFQDQMKGVFTTTANESTIDEAPDAYKPSEVIIDALEPTVEVTQRLMPAYNFKAADKRGR